MNDFVIVIDGVACCIDDGNIYISMKSIMEARLYREKFKDEENLGITSMKKFFEAINLPYRKDGFITEDKFVELMNMIYPVFEIPVFEFYRKVKTEVFPKALCYYEENKDFCIIGKHMEDDMLFALRASRKIARMERKEREQQELARTNQYLKAARLISNCSMSKMKATLELIENSGLSMSKVRELLGIEETPENLAIPEEDDSP